MRRNAPRLPLLLLWLLLPWFQFLWLAAATAGAADTLQQRAAAGEAAAQYRLAERLLTAPNPDYRGAAQWLLAAARQGHGGAQLRLGELYGSGRGVKLDVVRAYMWLQLASRFDQRAEAARRRLAENMSPAQIERARTYAEQLRNGREPAPEPAPEPAAQPDLSDTAFARLEPSREESPTTSEPVPLEEGPAFLLQLGSYANAANAEALAEKLRGEGFKPTLSPVTVAGRDYLRLRIGPYPSREAAAAALVDFKQRFLIDASLIPLAE